MNHKAKTTKRWMAAVALLLATAFSASAQEYNPFANNRSAQGYNFYSNNYAQDGYRSVISNRWTFGVGFNADTNHPTFTGSLRFMVQAGMPSDLVNVNFGVGYRGFFDRRPPVEFLYHESFSDYMLYSREDGHTKSVRPMGGQIIWPVEVLLNIFQIDDDAAIYLGGGMEYGLRLYQSNRYGNYYGAHVMEQNSLGFYPMVGVQFDAEDAIVNIGLYWRHQATRPMNGSEIDLDKFTAKDFFGIQINATF